MKDGQVVATIFHLVEAKGCIWIPGIKGGTSMKKAAILLVVASVVAGALITAAAPRPQPSPQSTPTIASAVDRDVSAVEKQIVEAADAMPEEKFNFTPEALNIAGSNY